MKPPPYAREMAEARRAGRPVNPWLFGGRDAWELAARRGPGRLVLPVGAEPSAFDWSVVSGFDVVVRWPGASLPEVDELGRLLVLAGARTVLVLDDLREDGNRMVLLRPHRRYVPSRAAA